jgi:hypothetical protein
MRVHPSIALLLAALLPSVATGAVLGSLAPVLINHYTFDYPLSADPNASIELDLGSDATNIQLLNGAPRVSDGAWWGSHYSLETGQRHTAANDDWKAGVMFQSSATSTLVGTNRVTGASIMGWFKPLGDVANNPSPNTNTEDPDDYYNSFGLAGLLRGDSNTDGLDGHGVRALIEVINGKVTGLGRRLDSQVGSGQRESLDDWHVVAPPGVWTHLTATFDFDHGTIDLYKNGLPLAASPANTSAWNVNNNTNRTSTSNAGGIKIGGSYPDNSQEFNPFNGRIDELMFFKKTLTASEVAAQFALVSNIPGDFNLDGTVDAADYTLWRDHLGDTASLANDPTPGVGEDDYDRWRANFGRSAIPGAGAMGLATSSVPEPAIGALMLLASLLPIRRRR